MEGLFIKKPYTNQDTIPIKNMISMGNDKEDTSFVFQVLYTWGKKAAVVKKAAKNPIISI